MEFGVTKYKRNNWRKGYPKEEILPSLQRHVGELIDAVNNGTSQLDHESGVHLVGPIIANAMIYSYHFVRRAKKGKNKKK